MWSRAVGAFYSIFSTFLCVFATTATTNRFRSTELLAMSKFLAVKALQGVWNIVVDLNSKISNVYVRRSCWSVESQDESDSWSSVIFSGFDSYIE